MPRRKKNQPVTDTETVADTALYPDLMPVIEKLQHRRALAPDDSRPVIDKWLTQLQDVQRDMRRLEKLERFSGTIRNHVARQGSETDE